MMCSDASFRSIPLECAVAVVICSSFDVARFLPWHKAIGLAVTYSPTS